MNNRTNLLITENINIEFQPVGYNDLLDALEIKLLKYEAVKFTLTEIAEEFYKSEEQKFSNPIV
jgi:hypothetical protein